MKKIFLIFTIIIFITLILFNPTKEDFNKKIFNDSNTSNNHTYEEYKAFGLTNLLESGYERKNYYIFSIYTTNGKTNKLWDKEEYKNKNITYIGILRNFIKIKEEI